MFSHLIAMFFHGEKKTDCETVDQQICDVSLYLRVSCVWVVKTLMNNPDGQFSISLSRSMRNSALQGRNVRIIGFNYGMAN